MLCLTVSAVSLSDDTWAWFTESSSATSGTLQFASYRVDVNVMDDENNALDPVDSSDIDSNSVVFKEFKASQAYSITLKGVGTVSSGYCIIKIDDAYYEASVNPDTELTFTYKTGSKAESSDSTLDSSMTISW